MRQKTARQPHDFYETPPHYLSALEAILKLQDCRVQGTLFEPCVGNGAIARWIRRIGIIGSDLVTNDIDPARKARYHYDARSISVWHEACPDWTITNPPFKHINRILDLGIRTSTNFITLARLSVLEPTDERVKLYRRFGKPQMMIVLPRYQFSKPSKDTMTCCWVGWGPSVPNYWGIDLTEPPK